MRYLAGIFLALMTMVVPVEAQTPERLAVPVVVVLDQATVRTHNIDCDALAGSDAVTVTVMPHSTEETQTSYPESSRTVPGTGGCEVRFTVELTQGELYDLTLDMGCEHSEILGAVILEQSALSVPELVYHVNGCPNPHDLGRWSHEALNGLVD